MSKKKIRSKESSIRSIEVKYRSCLKSITGDETFVGILVNHFFPNKDNHKKGISDAWGEKTASNYCNDYRIRLLNELPLLKGISEITVTELEDAVDRLVERYNYKDVTENHYRLLIRVVFEAAHRAGYSVEENVWGSVFFDSIISQTVIEKEFLSIPKSLTAFEAVSLFAALTVDIEAASGEDMGLLFMLLTGCRNEEVVPLTFEHFFLVGNTDIMFFAVFESATKIRDITKSGGKTKNAYRFIPVPSVLRDIVQTRKMMLSKKIRTVKMTNDDETKEVVNGLPVACFGGDYETRCLVDDLSRRARHHLRAIKYESKWLATVENMLISERRLENEIEEKEPTAYLLRRHHATMLYVLGFSETQQQYLMGHAISAVNADRRDYTNDDLRVSLWKRREC